MAYRTPKHVQEQKDIKRRHILDSALRVFARKGFYETSVQDICKEADVSVGAIYFYFPNKDSVYEAVYSDIMNNLVSSIEDAAKDETDVRKFIERSTRAAVTSMTSNIHVARFFRVNSYQTNLKQKVDDVLRIGASHFLNILERAIERGQIKPINGRKRHKMTT
ncbi:MAG: TetR/AcrR family transcriptional regulator [Actinobacteria bacterium]|nr:TetR/AcrR family transcriptional regulator [Actinomycetota bacterium]